MVTIVATHGHSTSGGEELGISGQGDTDGQKTKVQCATAKRCGMLKGWPQISLRSGGRGKCGDEVTQTGVSPDQIFSDTFRAWWIFMMSLVLVAVSFLLEGYKRKSENITSYMTFAHAKMSRK